MRDSIRRCDQSLLQSGLHAEISPIIRKFAALELAMELYDTP